MIDLLIMTYACPRITLPNKCDQENLYKSPRLIKGFPSCLFKEVGCLALPPRTPRCRPSTSRAPSVRHYSLSRLCGKVVRLAETQTINSEQIQIATFINDGLTNSVNVVPKNKTLDELLTVTAKEKASHGLTDFLKRPIVLATGKWKDTNAFGNELVRIRLPDAFLKNTSYVEKLSGFMGVRGDFRLKLQVNSQPFQQGRLKMQFIRYAKYIPNKVAGINANVTGRTGCPCVDLDLGEGTEVEMVIPWVSPHPYFNLVREHSTYGDVYVFVYGMLQDMTGLAEVEWTLWGSFDDVEVEFPTGAPMTDYNGKMALIRKIDNGSVSDDDWAKFKNFKLQSSEIEEVVSGGVLSTGVGQAGAAMSTLSKVPGLGMLRTPGWLADAASNALSVFGFSKPTLAAPNNLSKFRGQAFMGNFNGLDNSHKLALSATNELETVPGMAGAVDDEMSFSHISSTYNYFKLFKWQTKDVGGTVLFSTPVHPFLYGGGAVGYAMTHVGAVANVNSFWRGTLNYKFIFPKTKFHSGRLLFTFTPGSLGDASSVAQDYKLIVDMRTQSEVVFSVPYVSTRPWMDVISPYDDPNKNLLKYYSTGVLTVSVLNSLVAASTVSDSITVLVEVAGEKNGSDPLVFSGPTLPRFRPVVSNVSADEAEVTILAVTTPFSYDSTSKTVNVRLPPYLYSEDGAITSLGNWTVKPTNQGQPTVYCTLRYSLNGVSYSAIRTLPALYFEVVNEDGVIILNMVLDASTLTVNNEVPETITYENQTFIIVSPTKHDYVLQGVDVDSADNNSSRELVEDSFIGQTSSNMAPFSYTIGEYVNSFRQLLKRFSIEDTINLSSSQPSIAIAPYSIPNPSSSAPSMNYFEYISPLFVFYRGGMRYKLSISDTSTTSIPSKVNNFFKIYMFNANSWLGNYFFNFFRIGRTNQPAGKPAQYLLNSSPAMQVVDTSLEGLVEFEVPFYNSTHMCYAEPYSSLESKPWDRNDALAGRYPSSVVVASFDGNIPADSQLTVNVYKAPADDFSFFSLVGCPPMQPANL